MKTKMIKWIKSKLFPTDFDRIWTMDRYLKKRGAYRYERDAFLFRYKWWTEFVTWHIEKGSDSGSAANFAFNCDAREQFEKFLKKLPRKMENEARALIRPFDEKFVAATLPLNGRSQAPGNTSLWYTRVPKGIPDSWLQEIEKYFEPNQLKQQLAAINQAVIERTPDEEQDIFTFHWLFGCWCWFIRDSVEKGYGPEIFNECGQRDSLDEMIALLDEPLKQQAIELLKPWDDRFIAATDDVPGKSMDPEKNPFWFTRIPKGMQDCDEVTVWFSPFKS